MAVRLNNNEAKKGELVKGLERFGSRDFPHGNTFYVYSYKNLTCH